MSKLKTIINLETAFGNYSLDEILGEGGAGRVYGGTDEAGKPVAIKILTQTSSDKRRRFKNEIAFLSRNKHSNIVTVIDHGMATGTITGPFYVMRRYDGSLRSLIGQLPPAKALGLFSQILDGVEGAHLLGATHRDLKPENVLSDQKNQTVSIADFGIASFVDDQLATLVETGPTQRMANFQYAAPEQRMPGKGVTASADIYALGLILNEMFTGVVPHGTDYRLISATTKEYAFLDGIVSVMIKQNPQDRPASIAEIKYLIQKYQEEAVTLQRLSVINEAVVKMGEIDEPLAHTPPTLVGAEWDNGTLRLTLDRSVTNEWIYALQNMGSFTSIMGAEPTRFSFRGNSATVAAPEHSVQAIIDYFKPWLSKATNVLKHNLEQKAREAAAQRSRELQQQREAEESRLRVNRNIRI